MNVIADDEQLVVFLADLVDSDDAGMMQAGGRTSFPQESLGFQGGQLPFPRQLDGHDPLQLAVPGRPDLVILLYVHNAEYVARQCDTELRRLGSQPWDRWSGEVVTFCARRTDDTAILEAAETSRNRLCMARYLIAMKCLADNDLVAANEQLRLCAETLHYGDRWVQAFLNRLEKNSPASE